MNRFISFVVCCSLFLTPEVTLAIGGQKQSALVCQKGAFPGVGLVIHQQPNAQNHSQGTFQVLPHSDRKLCVTARHCVDGPATNVTEVRIEGEVIPVRRIFIHPDPKCDLALFELERSAPVAEAALPQLPTVDLKSKAQWPLEGTVVGFGLSSSDDLNLALRAPTHTFKRSGSVQVLSEEFDYGKFKKKHFIARWNPAFGHTKVFTGAGDSGGPLIGGNTLLGVTIQGGPCVPDMKVSPYIGFISKTQHEKFIKDKATILDQFMWEGKAAIVYADPHDSKQVVKIYREGLVNKRDKIANTKMYNDIIKMIDEHSGLDRPGSYEFASKITGYIVDTLGPKIGFHQRSIFFDVTDPDCLGWMAVVYKNCGFNIDPFVSTPTTLASDA